ncbi:MAG TPA: hypothetical protein VLD16_04155 [Gaiellaceae bacterium]|nr:hypothetical protein [Gaiellaceae bacterium]
MKKLALIGMVVAGLLLSTSTAWSKPTGMTKAEYQALIARSEGLNQKYGLGQSSQTIVRQKLGEIGAWAVPSRQRLAPSTNQKLEEIGAWAVPSKSVSTPITSSTGSGFDWNYAGIGAALALAGALALGAVLTVRHQQHRPIPH